MIYIDVNFLFQAKADEILGKVMVQVEEIKSKETLFIQFKHTLVSILHGFEPLTAMYNFLLSSSEYRVYCLKIAIYHLY